MAEKLKWHTEKRKVKNLKFYEKNPRKMSDDDKKELSKSIDRFNLVEIPAINTDNMLVAGHQRIDDLLSKGRGDEEIDVRVPNRPLTKKEFREYNIRSNKNHGEFDNDILRKDFTLEELEFFGFDEIENEESHEIKEIELKPYKKYHILISINPEILDEIQDILNQIINIPGVEYEQSAN